jgi:hypothetical protein
MIKLFMKIKKQLILGHALWNFIGKCSRIILCNAVLPANTQIIRQLEMMTSAQCFATERTQIQKS